MGGITAFLCELVQSMLHPLPAKTVRMGRWNFSTVVYDIEIKHNEKHWYSFTDKSRATKKYNVLFCSGKEVISTLQKLREDPTSPY